MKIYMLKTYFTRFSSGEWIRLPCFLVPVKEDLFNLQFLYECVYCAVDNLPCGAILQLWTISHCCVSSHSWCLCGPEALARTQPSEDPRPACVLRTSPACYPTWIPLADAAVAWWITWLLLCHIALCVGLNLCCSHIAAYPAAPGLLWTELTSCGAWITAPCDASNLCQATLLPTLLCPDYCLVCWI